MTKTVHRFAPYPIYDFEETTKWLEEMAANGYILKKYRTFLRTASFTKGAPQNIRYGITPKPKSIHQSPSSLEELTAICEAQGWHYMEKIDNYCLFNTTDSQAPDLFTDQESYLQSLKTILKKQYRSVLLLLPCFLASMYILCSSDWDYIIKNDDFFLLLPYWMIFIELLFTSYIPFLMETFYLRKYVKTIEKGEPAKSSKYLKTLHKITVWGAVFAVLSVYICLLFNFR